MNKLQWVFIVRGVVIMTFHFSDALQELLCADTRGSCQVNVKIGRIWRNNIWWDVSPPHAEKCKLHFTLGDVRTHWTIPYPTVYNVMLWPLHFHYPCCLSSLRPSWALALSLLLALWPVRLQVRLSPFHSHLLGLCLCLTGWIAPPPWMSWLIPG